MTQIFDPDQVYEMTYREEAIFRIYSDRYHIQLQRTRDIESKATCLLGYIGIVFGFIATIGVSNIYYIINNIVLETIYFLSIISLVVTFILAARSVYYETAELRVLDNNIFMKKYVLTNTELNEIFPMLTMSFNKFIDEIGKMNKKKNRSLQLSLIIFFFSILFVTFFCFYYACVYESTSQTSGFNDVNDVNNSTVNNTIKTNDINNVTALSNTNHTDKINISRSKFNGTIFPYKDLFKMVSINSIIHLLL